jgi:hypothetical protein
MMAHPAGFFDRQLEDRLSSRRQVEPAAATLTGSGQAFNHFLHAVWLEPELAEHAPRNPTLFPDQPEKQVLGAYIVMSHALCFLVSKA